MQKKAYICNEETSFYPMKRNSELKDTALAALKGNWAKAILATVIFLAIYLVAAGPYSMQTFKMQTYMQEEMGYTQNASLTEIVNMSMAMTQDPTVVEMQTKARGYSGWMYLVYFFLIFPLTLGFMNALLKLLRTGDASITENTFHIAFQNYWHKVWGMVLMHIFIWLWSLLLIIPGIIKSFSYAMTPFILEENPELSANEAIDRSRAMMRGHKFDLFWLLLSFIGWFFLCILTFGIGFLWLVPYMQTTEAAFYQEVKADYELNGGLI